MLRVRFTIHSGCDKGKREGSAGRTNRIRRKLARTWAREFVLLSREIIARRIPTEQRDRAGKASLPPGVIMPGMKRPEVISLGSCKVPRNKVSSLSLCKVINIQAGDPASVSARWSDHRRRSLRRISCLQSTAVEGEFRRQRAIGDKPSFLSTRRERPDFPLLSSPLSTGYDARVSRLIAEFQLLSGPVHRAKWKC